MIFLAISKNSHRTIKFIMVSMEVRWWTLYQNFSPKKTYNFVIHEFFYLKSFSVCKFYSKLSHFEIQNLWTLKTTLDWEMINIKVVDIKKYMQLCSSQSFYFKKNMLSKFSLKLTQFETQNFKQPMMEKQPKLNF